MGKANLVWPAKIMICEAGLRDGLQNEKNIFSVEEKLQPLDVTVPSDIKIIEIGSFARYPKAEDNNKKM